MLHGETIRQSELIGLPGAVLDGVVRADDGRHVRYEYDNSSSSLRSVRFYWLTNDIPLEVVAMFSATRLNSGEDPLGGMIVTVDGEFYGDVRSTGQIEHAGLRSEIEWMLGVVKAAAACGRAHQTEQQRKRREEREAKKRTLADKLDNL